MEASDADRVPAMDGIGADRVRLTVDDETVSVRYFAGGTGPPLVFLHGIGIDAAPVAWRRALPALADEFAVYAPDLPGHGGSDKPRRTYSTAYFRDVLAAFLDALDLRGASLAGLSMGGAVALGHALDGGDPESLVLVDSYGLGGDAYWRAPAALALRTPFTGGGLWGSTATRAGVRTYLRGLTGECLPEDLVEDVRRVVSPATMRTLRSWQRHEFRVGGLRTDYSDRLAELTAPTTLVHGAADPLLPVAWSRRAAERLPDAELRVFEGCGHWPPREKPDAFADALTRGVRR
ncbi:MAG: alpha/beta fold hydrolase [Haloarculaceae archaeon]